ncbi:MAG: S26 family signal peptidase [Actinobacteria bacterium]|jgi:signal peptidase I|nr:S26 family signal peptidase [Actinomycetota bacterium]
MFGFSTVEVSGNSMAPTYSAGDWLLVRYLSGKKHTLEVGKVYLVEDPQRPGIRLLKRLMQSRSEHGVMRYWVEGDNSQSTDSRDWGWLEQNQLLARVLIRYKKGN